MVSSTTQRLVSVDILTPSFRIVGKVVISAVGLAGHLNDPNTSFLEVIDAKLARIHMPTKLIHRFEILRMAKPQIFAVSVQRARDLGPQKIVQGGFQNLKSYNVYLATPVYELHGRIESPGRFNFAALMVEGTREFVPLYDATVHASLIPSARIESPAMLFNRAQVDWMGLEKDKIEENS